MLRRTSSCPLPPPPPPAVPSSGSIIDVLRFPVTSPTSAHSVKSSHNGNSPSPPFPLPQVLRDHLTSSPHISRFDSSTVSVSPAISIRITCHSPLLRRRFCAIRCLPIGYGLLYTPQWCTVRAEANIVPARPTAPHPLPQLPRLNMLMLTGRKPQAQCKRDSS
ncbi:hypothetical protein BU23DRAFT_219618 [Bimuria novae-zelandiae CBS 107.79]|uniref:Uncharacterized protein n=1 Tax=Bimuria novae-zelandiae CBS 107.79 TaxID=1447943 RepID=A0A6A5V9Q0_9PLEO|nr:hypothetical protein BU23DRAFT_219618 [Bimuria novae-zelandiae CBS 107.79]